MSRRFYKTASVAKADDTVGDGFVITLDGRTVKTPGKLTLLIADRTRANVVAAEWNAQGDEIRPETMPCTRLMNVAVELTPHNRDALVAEAQSYAGTDCICYRADAPAALSHRQDAVWDPVLDWARGRGIVLKPTRTVLAIDQDPDALSKVGEYARGLSDVDLTLYLHLTALYGSAILAMAAMENYMSTETAYDASRIDAQFQIENWGVDEDEAVRIAAQRDELRALSQLILKR